MDADGDELQQHVDRTAIHRSSHKLHDLLPGIRGALTFLDSFCQKNLSEFDRFSILGLQGCW